MTTTPETAHPVETVSELRVQQIPIIDIDCTRNHRIPQPGDEAQIHSLMQSIEAAGQLQPVRVYEAMPGQAKDEESYILGFGWRRVEALKRLGRDTVLAVVHPPAPDDQIEAGRAIENLHRADIGPMEEVLAVAQLLKICSTPAFAQAHPDVADPYEYVAAELGQTVRWVRDRDYLHRLHPATQMVALQTQLPAGHLREIAKVGDERLQLEITIEAAGGQAHYVDLEQTLATNKITSQSSPRWGGGRQDYQEEIDQWLSRTTEASHHRMTLRQVRDQVEEAQRSLKSVAWRYELPVVTSTGDTLRACQGCPSNSETDRTLFGLEDQEPDPQNPRGVCLNPSCYKAKTQATETVKAQLAKAFSRRKRPPAANEIDEKAPDWIKPATARGYVQREHKKRQEQGDANAAGAAAASRAPRSRNGERPLTTHEQALEKFSDAMHKWEDSTSRAILDGCNQKPLHHAALCVLVFTAAWQTRQHAWNIPYISKWQNKATTESPEPPKPIDPDLAEAVDLFSQGKLTALEKLAQLKQGHGDGSLHIDEEVLHPEALVRMAEAVGAKIDPCPDWEDFKPQSAEEKAAEKVAVGDGKKATPGVCRGCGCTDAEGCIEGCHWVDETHTLCSMCGGSQPAGKKASKKRSTKKKASKKKARKG